MHVLDHFIYLLVLYNLSHNAVGSGGDLILYDKYYHILIPCDTKIVRRAVVEFHNFSSHFTFHGTRATYSIRGEEKVQQSLEGAT